ncbi:MAG TPA: Mur ligase family protein [Chloroflexota bacterium]|nr:Mur ligase family protein [Chloroflexota bacterium]
MRLKLAVAAGRAAGLASQRLKRGGGTTLPGVVARFVDRSTAGRLAAGLRNGCILVSGTNGKTTTSRLISAMLAKAGRRVVHNRAGANLMSGVTTALLHSEGDTGLFEIDEAALPAAIAELRPQLVLCLNLFRDQLDRYGELNTLASKWAQALRALDPQATVLLNGDDPLVASLARDLACNVRFFGLDASELALEAMQHAADSIYCPCCGGLLAFDTVYYGHLGAYRCDACGFARPPLDFAASRVQLSLEPPPRLTIAGLALETSLPGLYNAYNVVAAASAGLSLGLPPELVAASVKDFAAAFGRTETVEMDGRRLRLLLAKNPVGFNEVIRTLLLDPNPLHLYLALNDRIADGEDVSWIWDVDFEQLAGRCATVIAGGTRAEDLAVRLKYAGFASEMLRLARDHPSAVRELLAATPAGATAYAVPTYTAMLDLRAALAQLGVVRQYWED